MKTIPQLMIRILIVSAVVVLVTGLIYFLSGGRTSRGLSDWLVYASFLTFGIGTVVGVMKVGTRAVKPGEEISEEETGLPALVSDFFRAGVFGVAVTLAGVVCFLVAILVDGLF